MRESTTYQAILEEGRADEARRIVLRQGRQKFGQPDRRVQAALERITDVEQLERLADRVLAATTWEELLRPS